MAEERTSNQAKIDQALIDLASLNAAKRRDAAYLMGEMAYDDAIPTLVNLYRNDKNPGVRRAAEYALGQFRAVEIGMSQGEEAKITALLRQIEIGKVGRRAPVGARVRLLLALLLSLGLIAVLFTFQSALAGRILGGRTERSALLTDVRTVFRRVSDDTNRLRDEYINVISGGSLSCNAFFNNPPPYVLDPRDANAYPDIVDIVNAVNDISVRIQAARAPYDQACAGGQFGVENASAAMLPVSAVITDRNNIETALTFAEANTVRPTAIPPTATPAPPTATTPATAVPPTDTAPTTPPTLPPADLSRLLQAVYAPIDEVTGARGAATLLITYWEEAGRSGATAGCTAQRPPIPDALVFTPEDLAQSAEIAAAVQAVNEGLNALRTGWTDYAFACNTGANAVAADSPRGLANARAALGALVNARALLDMLRDSGGAPIVPSATP